MARSNIQKKIKHVVVLMLENRSFDNLAGWLYGGTLQPRTFRPDGTPERYNGLAGADYSNPIDFSPGAKIHPAVRGVAGDFRIPTPDPNEAFKHMNVQLFGSAVKKAKGDDQSWLPPEGQVPSMQGFLADYVTAKCSTRKIAPQIMRTFSPDELTAMSNVAWEYAISDNYHASCPTQTWPNRAFMHAGTSEGRVNNFPYLPYGAKTIFNVFEEEKVSWRVYKSSEILPSLTRIQMTELWDPLLDDHFHHVSRFIEDCRCGDLPDYSFVEPSFVVEAGTRATSEHPPSDVCAGDHFLTDVCNAVVQSPDFAETLLIINFDEHGGCPDHVPPTWTAVSPDKHSDPGHCGFRFNRYGVRVPAIFVSPHIEKGTLIRAGKDPWSDNAVPFDHTSILAMLLDWKGIARDKLPSKRVQAQPQAPFDELLTGDLRTDRPRFVASCAVTPPQGCLKAAAGAVRKLFGGCPDGGLTALQESIVVAHAHHRAARERGDDRLLDQAKGLEVLKKVRTEAQMVRHFESIQG